MTKNWLLSFKPPSGYTFGFLYFLFPLLIQEALKISMLETVFNVNMYANVQGNKLMRLEIPSNIIQSKPKIMLCSAQFELKPN